MGRDHRAKKKSFLELIRGFPGILNEYLVPIGVAIFSGVAVAWLVSNFVEPVREVLVERQLVNVLLFLLVVNTLLYLDRLARQLGVAGLRGIVRVSPDQGSDTPAMVAAVEALAPGTARFVEFSGYTVLDLITEVLRRGWDVELLVKHPESVGHIQRNTVLMVLQRLELLTTVDIPGSKDRLHVKCYRANASLRGRKLGDKLVNLGWYTPTFLRDQEGNPLEVLGHANPLITARVDAPEGRCFGRMFDRVFQELWEDPSTVDWQEVLKKLGSKRRKAKQ